jgi:hypothetical protein
MTVEDMIGHARRFSRTTESSHSNDTVISLLNEGQREFYRDCGGMWTENYLTLAPIFDVKDNFYFKIILGSASASFPINASSSNLFNVTGASVGVMIASSIQGTWAAATCGWDTSAWRFYITIPAETNIQVTSPDGATYIDVTDIYFGGGSSQATASWLSNFPDECTVETSLPTGFYSIEHVEWDRDPLTQAPFDIFMSPETSGDPEYYSIKNKKIRVYPVPDEQKLFHIFYRYLPVDFGVASSTGSGSMSASSSLDAEVQMAPVFYAASLMAEQNFEKDIADRMYSRYRKMLLDYRQNFNNQNPQMFMNPAAERQWYKVDMS